MSLKLHYDPDSDAIGLNYSQPSGATHEIEGLGWVMIDLPDEESHDAVALEVIGISAWLPLGRRGYSLETDTLTFGDGAKTATITAANGDLVVSWRSDSSAIGGLTPFAVDLRNASKHLAPVIAAMSKTLNTAN